MTETPMRFGPDSAMVGVLTQPTAHEQPGVAFLMFNAGVLPRTGPHRMNVKLARALGEIGQTSLRFDLMGQGDSRGAITQSDFLAQAVHDIRAAMDHLEQTVGVHRFALIGFCSGAVNAFDASLADRRVAAVLMFDGHWYHSRWSVPVRRWKRFRVMAWPKIASAVQRRIAKPIRSQARAGEGTSAPESPSREEFARAVLALTERRVAVLFVYSGSVIEYYSYTNQLRDVFGREAFFDKVRCEFRPDIDHTFLSLDVQQRMLALVVGWVAEVKQACESTA